MKKINFKLHLGVIGEADKGKNMILEFLSHLAISPSSSPINEFQIIHQSTPLKVRVFEGKNIREFIDLYDNIGNLDAIIQILDLHEPDSITQILQDDYNDFQDLYDFQGSKILVAVDLDLIKNRIAEERLRISRLSLVRKTQEINFIYCFEINQYTDFTELFEKLFNDSILKFKFSRPELYEQALNYGNMLINQRIDETQKNQS